jgi:hypothetical protein
MTPRVLLRVTSSWAAPTPARSVPRDPSLRVRLRATRQRLDGEIAGGAPVDGSPARSLRAKQLTSPSTRRAIAAILANILDSAEERRIDWCSRLIVEYNAVLEARDGILELIALLRSDTTLAPRAVVLAARLAERSDSPIVSRSCGKTIRQALAEIAAAQ